MHPTRFESRSRSGRAEQGSPSSSVQIGEAAFSCHRPASHAIALRRDPLVVAPTPPKGVARRVPLSDGLERNGQRTPLRRAGRPVGVRPRGPERGRAVQRRLAPVGARSRARRRLGSAKKLPADRRHSHLPGPGTAIRGRERLEGDGLPHARCRANRRERRVSRLRERSTTHGRGIFRPSTICTRPRVTRATGQIAG